MGHPVDDDESNIGGLNSEYLFTAVNFCSPKSDPKRSLKWSHAARPLKAKDINRPVNHLF